VTFQVDLDVIWVDLHVFGKHGDQVALQRGQIVGLGVTTCALVGEDELQTLFGNVGCFFFSPSKRESNDMVYFPPKIRLSKLGLTCSVKRMGKSSPKKRLITSL